jgi:hypothetical protein
MIKRHILAIGLVLGIAVAAGASLPAHAQQTRTTCYDSGSTRICETFDGMGNVISKSRCYKSGRDTRCDTLNFGGGQATPLPLDRNSRR